MNISLAIMYDIGKIDRFGTKKKQLEYLNDSCICQPIETASNCIHFTCNGRNRCLIKIN